MKKLLVGATLLITMAVVRKRIAINKSISNELQTISSSLITDYNNTDINQLLEYSARINSIIRSCQ